VSPSNRPVQFGPNEWLVEEMYEQFLANPSTVDPSWHDFFADRPAPLSGNGQAPRASTQAPPKQPPATRDRGQAVVRTHAQHDLEQDTTTPLRGAAARVVANMETSLELPTATSVRAIPAKLLVDNRIVINNHLNRTHGGKVSFTHLIGYAVVRALADIPQMNRHYTTDNQGKPAVVAPEHVNLGLAIDLKTDKGRSLLVASIKGCEVMTFTQFWHAYEDIIRKARGGKLTAEDLAASTISLTNPGTIGTNHSVPRLMSGQGAIIGVGAMEFPAAFQGASDQALAKMAISKIITLTSTYDHRIIQGAESGEFLRRVHELVLGEDGFYDDLFAALRVPYEPVRWVQDIPEGEVAKTARVLELIDAFRTRGHLMADTDPLNYRQRKHPDLDVLSHGLTLWDLDREFAVGGFAGQSHMRLRDVLGVLRNAYCRNVGVEYTHIAAPDERRWLQEVLLLGAGGAGAR
jgi:2-oxoglutarate decarboxylase